MSAPTTPQEMLLATADLLEANGWTQQVMACNRFGIECRYESKDAVCWCALGGMRKIGGEWLTEAQRLLRRHLGCTSIMEWNDEPGRTKEQVIEAMRGAAK